ncbi:DUF3564 family protein [Paraburkholderia phymatum]|uniref:DUF3564 family protein n=1 Tax=Paraburkholderia phymatum TaxID=148447 RepID=UPI0031718A92
MPGARRRVVGDGIVGHGTGVGAAILITTLHAQWSRASLWLDNEAQKWSREGHAGLRLPDWGTLQVDARGTLIRGPHDALHLFILEDLAMNAPNGPFEGESGEALWCYHERAIGPRVVPPLRAESLTCPTQRALRTPKWP